MKPPDPAVTQEQADAIAAIRRMAYDESPEYRAYIDAACERTQANPQNQIRREAVQS